MPLLECGIWASCKGVRLVQCAARTSRIAWSRRTGLREFARRCGLKEFVLPLLFSRPPFGDHRTDAGCSCADGRGVINPGMDKHVASAGAAARNNGGPSIGTRCALWLPSSSTQGSALPVKERQHGTLATVSPGRDRLRARLHLRRAIEPGPDVHGVDRPLLASRRRTHGRLAQNARLESAHPHRGRNDWLRVRAGFRVSRSDVLEPGTRYGELVAAGIVRPLLEPHDPLGKFCGPFLFRALPLPSGLTRTVVIHQAPAERPSPTAERRRASPLVGLDLLQAGTHRDARVSGVSAGVVAGVVPSHSS